MKLIVIVALSLIPGVAFAGDSIKALVCNFNGLSSLALDKEIQSRGLNRTGEKLDFTFAALDFKASKAQMIGNAGSSDVFIHAGTGAISFFEFLPTGGTTVTTVYTTPIDGALPAVHSRHTGGSVVTPIVSQYAGKCSARS